METNLIQRNADFLKKIARAPRGLEKKIVSKYELDPFFSVISLEDLASTLHRFANEGYFKIEIMLSHEYLEWEEANAQAIPDPNLLTPPEILFGTSSPKRHSLAIMGRPIKIDTPLSVRETNYVIRELASTNSAERFLRFRLSNIKQKELREIVAARSATSKGTPKIDNHYTVGIKGLIISGGEVTYKRKRIPMNRRQKELLRMFLEKPEATPLSPDRFIDSPEIFKPDKTYDYPYATFSKLISETHQILKQTVGECIFRDANGNWYLRIE